MTTPGARFTRSWLLVILATFAVLAIFYSLAVPLFEGPDEIWHYAFANHLASGGGLPVFDAQQPATFLRDGAHPPLYYLLIAALIAPIDRNDFPAEYRFNLANPMITQGASGTSPNLLIHTAREDFPYHGTALAAHIARLVSISLGALAILGVFAVAHRLLRDDRLALIATALVAFIPQFVYGTALINNDALAAVSATWLLYTLLRLMDDLRWRWVLLSGILLGVTLLSKIGMIAVLPIPAVALGMMYLLPRRHRGTEDVSKSSPCLRVPLARLLVSALVLYGVAVLIAGWWYARNVMLYGDPLMWREWQALTGAGRVPPTLLDFVRDMIGLFGTFWADFSLRVDRALWPVFGLIIMAVIAGLTRRAIKREWPTLDWAGLFIALTWSGLLLASAVRYSFSIYNVHGRLLYPVMSVIGVMLALGLSAWPRSKWVIGIVLAPMVLITMLAPLVIIQPAYARPIVFALPEGTIKTSAKFGDVEFVGYHVKDDRVKAGEPIELVTYWRTAARQQAESHVVALALRQNGGIVGRTENLLGTDAYPSSVWQPGEIVETPLSLPTSPDNAGNTVVHLTLGLSANMAHTIDLGRVVVTAAQACEIDRAADVMFGGSIKLVGYRIEESTATGVAPRISLCWESIKPVPIDYTVFVHVPVNNGQLTADAQPADGAYPTSAWRPGERVADAHPLPAVYDLKIPQASVGLYRLDTGERLTIDGTNETEFVITK